MAPTGVSCKTAQPEKKRHQSLPRNRGPSPGLSYKLSVSETIKMGSKKTNQQNGIEGYELKLWHHDVDKPIVYKIHKKLKEKHYLDDYLKTKKIVPPPDTYNIAKDFSIK